MKRPTLLYVLFYLVFAAFLFRNVLFEPGTIGLRNDWSLAPFPIQYEARFEQALTSWTHDYLGLPLLRRTDILLTLVLALFAKVFQIGGAVFSKVIPIAAFMGSGLFSFFLLRRVLRDELAAFTGSLLYMLSPIAFNAVAFGQHHFLLGYALFPLLLLGFLRTLESPRPIGWIAGTGLLYAVAMSQDTFFIIGGVSMAAVAAAHVFWREPSAPSGERASRRHRLQRAFGRLLRVALLGVLLQAPTFFSALTHISEVGGTFRTISFAWNTWRSPEAVNVFTLDGAGIQYFLSAIPSRIRPYWQIVNSLAVLVIFSVVLLPLRKRVVLPLFGLALGSLFLFKGSHPPLGTITQWIFEHVPGMLMFRNTQYFTIFTNLLFAVLLALVVRFWHATAATAPERRRRQLAGAFGLLLALLLVRSYPLLTGDFRETIQLYNLGPAYEDLYRRFYRDPEDYRILWLPPAQPMSFRSTELAGLDPFGSQTPKASIIDNAVHPLEWLLHMVMYTRPQTNLGELLRALAVRYVVVRDEFVSRTPNFQWGEFPKSEWTNVSLKRFVDAQPSLEAAETYGPHITVFRHSDPRPRVDTAGGFDVSTGDLSDFVFLGDYWSAVGVPARDLLFVQDVALGPTTRQVIEDGDRVMIVNNNLLDLAAMFFAPQAKEVRIERVVRDAKDGWSPKWPWKDWRYASILEPAVFTVTAHMTPVSFTTKTVEQAQLWVKSYKSAKGSEFHVRLDGKDIGTIPTVSETLQGLQWDALPLGTLREGPHTLSMTTREGENVIARMLIVPESAVGEAQRSVAEYLKARDVFLAWHVDFRRESPAFTSVVRPAPDDDLLVLDADIPLVVPVDGTYDLALQIVGGPYVDQRQVDSDSYQTIERGKMVGQTFLLGPRAAVVEGFQVRAEARSLSTNTPAAVIPDAPLRARLFRLGRGGKIPVAEVEVPASSAGVHDAWQPVQLAFTVTLPPQTDASTRYFIEFSTEASNVVWAVSTIRNGFRGVADHYPGGTLFVNGVEQPHDLEFSVLARSAKTSLKSIAIDGRRLPSAETVVPWFNRSTVDLAEGSHLLQVRGLVPETTHVQLVLRRRGVAHASAGPPTTFTRGSDVRFSTGEIRPTAPYVLIFREAFDPGWKATLRFADGTRQQLAEAEHLKLDGYANAWRIREQRPHRVDIAYAPQRAYSAGLLASAVTFVGILGMSGYALLRRRP